MPDISLLPEELRKKEEQLKQTTPPPKPAPSSELKFSVPPEEGEDVEVIEIDEGEIEQVLANEPFFTRTVFRIESFFHDLTAKLFAPKGEEPPPKLPPHFFVPPAKKIAQVADVGAHAVRPTTAAGEAPKPKARIIPAAEAPRRVRVIKRIRKPVRVSFVSEESLRILHIDVGKRRFTFIAMTILFAVILAGGTVALSQLQDGATADLNAANAQLADVRKNIAEKNRLWSTFQDLEPRLKALTALLNTHMSPTRLLERLEGATLPTVQYNLFTLTPDKKITLGVLTNSFDSAARQIVAFQQSGFVQRVEGSGYAALYGDNASPSPTTVAFQLTLTLSDNAFAP